MISFQEENTGQVRNFTKIENVNRKVDLQSAILRDVQIPQWVTLDPRYALGPVSTPQVESSRHRNGLGTEHGIWYALLRKMPIT